MKSSSSESFSAGPWCNDHPEYQSTGLIAREPWPHRPCAVLRKAGLAAKTINFINPLILRYIGIESPHSHCWLPTGHYRVLTQLHFQDTNLKMHVKMQVQFVFHECPTCVQSSEKPFKNFIWLLNSDSWISLNLHISCWLSTRRTSHTDTEWIVSMHTPLVTGQLQVPCQSHFSNF